MPTLLAHEAIAEGIVQWSNNGRMDINVGMYRFYVADVGSLVLPTCGTLATPVPQDHPPDRETSRVQIMVCHQR